MPSLTTQLARYSASDPRPLDAGFGYFKYYKSDDFPQRIKFNGINNKINISLYDLDGYLINLNGTNWEFGLRKLN